MYLKQPKTNHFLIIQVKCQLCTCRPGYDLTGTKSITVCFLHLPWSLASLVSNQIFLKLNFKNKFNIKHIMQRLF